MGPAETLIRGLGPLLLAFGFALWFDRELDRRGLAPPGFASPWRRALASAVLAGGLWVTVFAGVGYLGSDRTGPDPASLGRVELFATHALLGIILLSWYLLGHAGRGAASAAGAGPGARFGAQVGWDTPSLAGDLGLGLAAGVGIWIAVIVAVVLAALAVAALGGEELLPRSPPALVPWLAAQPVLLRLLLACSAGFVEETFFRGFLEPRVGVGGATVAFVLAHLTYDQPWMLVGVTLLSLSFSALVRWRQTIVPAIVAHAFFDAVQLLVVIPALLEQWGGGLPLALARASFGEAPW